MQNQTGRRSWSALGTCGKKTLLVKVSWHLLNEPDSIWSRLVKAKYRGNHEFLKVFQEKRNSLHIWRGIVGSSHILAGSFEVGSWKWPYNSILDESMSWHEAAGP